MAALLAVILALDVQGHGSHSFLATGWDCFSFFVAVPAGVAVELLVLRWMHAPPRSSRRREVAFALAAVYASALLLCLVASLLLRSRLLDALPVLLVFLGLFACCFFAENLLAAWSLAWIRRRLAWEPMSTGRTIRIIALESTASLVVFIALVAACVTASPAVHSVRRWTDQMPLHPAALPGATWLGGAMTSDPAVRKLIAEELGFRQPYRLVDIAECGDGSVWGTVSDVGGKRRGFFLDYDLRTPETPPDAPHNVSLGPPGRAIPGVGVLAVASRPESAFVELLRVCARGKLWPGQSQQYEVIYGPHPDFRARAALWRNLSRNRRRVLLALHTIDLLEKQRSMRAGIAPGTGSR